MKPTLLSERALAKMKDEAEAHSSSFQYRMIRRLFAHIEAQDELIKATREYHKQKMKESW